MTSETAEDFYNKRRLNLHRKSKYYQPYIGWISLLGIVLSVSGVFTPSNTYVRCEDASISHSLRKDTVTVTLLLVLSLFVPFMTMILFEWLNFYRSQTPSPFYTGWKRSYSFFLSLLAGSLFSFFIVETLKTAVSEPRPHFMSSCKPNLTKEICRQEQWIHITWENCTNPHKLSNPKLLDTMKSFPSGHASASVFSVIFMTMYIQRRVDVPWSKLLNAWLLMLWWTWAIFCCASRVWDSKHHWWDVVVGGILGAVPGYATVVYLCNSFKDDSKNRFLGEESLPLDQGADSPSRSTPQKGNYLRAPRATNDDTAIHLHSSSPATELIIQ